MNKKEFNKNLAVHKEWLDSDGQKGKQLLIQEKNLSHLELSGKDFEKAIFIKCDFGDADLLQTTFPLATIKECNLEQAKNLSINSFEMANLLGTKLPSFINFQEKLQSANQFALSQQKVSTFYVASYLFFLFICLSLSDVDILAGNFTLPNPFFELTTPISLPAFLVVGLGTFYLIDRVLLIPMTVDATNALRKLPRILPTGEETALLISAWAFRWAIQRQSDLDNTDIRPNKHKEAFTDADKSISWYFALVFSIRHIALLIFTAIIGIYGTEQIFLNYFSAEMTAPTEKVIFGQTFFFSPTYFFLLILVAYSGMYLNAQGFRLGPYTRILLGIAGIFTILKIYPLAAIFYILTIGMNTQAREDVHTRRKNFAGITIIIITCFIISVVYNKIDVSNKKISREITNFTSARNISFDGPNLTGFNLYGSKAVNAYLPGTNFSNSILQNSDFSYADLRSANFGGAIVKGLKINGADLRNSRITKEQLCQTIGFETAQISFDFDCNVKNAQPSPKISE